MLAERSIPASPPPPFWGNLRTTSLTGRAFAAKRSVPSSALIVYGNCQAHLLAVMLSADARIVERFRVRYVSSIRATNDPSVISDEMIASGDDSSMNRSSGAWRIRRSS